MKTNIVKKVSGYMLGILFFLIVLVLEIIDVNATEDDRAERSKHYDIRVVGGDWDGNNYILNGNKIVNAFFCDGVYTYYLQADGTPMKDRLTYHPNGEHVIYFDEKGHEVFNDFHKINKSIEGNTVNDLCYFDSNGYMYVDVLTYDKMGKELIYVNPYGQIERNGWFEFASTSTWAGTTKKVGAGKGYARTNGTLVKNSYMTDITGEQYYIAADGHLVGDSTDVKAQNYASKTKYLCLVNCTKHVVGIYEGSVGKWKCIKKWQCGDGKASTPTPRGVFEVSERGPYFDSEGSRCFYWVRFKGPYLFHTVLCNNDMSVKDGTVGAAISHGCVRLEVQNAKWIYDNIPRGTKVVVYDE